MVGENLLGIPATLLPEETEVLARLDDAMAEVADAEGLNTAVDVIKELPVIYDSRVRAQQAVKAKAADLGLTLNKQTKRYE